MYRLFIPFISESQNEIYIEGEKARYISIVLRRKTGDPLIIFDNTGKCFRTEIVKIDNKRVIARIIESISIDTESNTGVILLQGILKGEKMDFVVQKATELGIKEIIPVITERSQVRITRKTERWRKIAEEASRQSGRVIVPVIHEPVEFSIFLKKIKSRLIYRQETDKEQVLRNFCKTKGEIEDKNTGVTGLIFWEEDGMPLKEAVLYLTASPFYITIGPEGGFTKEEISIAMKNGLTVTSLGKRILRAETAAIAAISIIQYAIGDIG